MEGNTSKSFPFKCKELEPDEKEAVLKCFKSPYMDYVRVEPGGYILTKEYFKEAPNIYNLAIRTDDFIVLSFQRSGTTWTQELVWLLANNLDYTAAAATPITRRYPFLEVFMIFSKKWQENFVKNKKNQHKEALAVMEVMSSPMTGTLTDAPLASPRFIKSHLPLCLLPPGLLDTAKVVYVARDPRDVAVSFYHQCKLFDDIFQLSGTFKEFWHLFTKDLVLYSPYFVHVKDAWEKRYHPNMLFLFYEDLIKDLPEAVQRVADFFGKILSTEELSNLCEHLSIDNFKNNKSVNYEDLREHGFFSDNETFIRKGKSGGWREYFDAEMTQQAEQWMADNLRDTDLRFSSDF